VTRQLLISGKIENPQTVKLSLETHIPNFRYVFDDAISPWLNKINKQGQLNNFQMISESDVSFVIDKSRVSELVKICPPEFKIIL
jgi:hypothetical protein